MLAALAFLPLNEVRQAFMDLYNIDPNDADFEFLLDYFGRYYINGTITFRLVGGRQIAQRTPALFPPELWNQRESTLLGRDRTNNRNEGNNNKLNKRRYNLPGRGVHNFLRFIQVLLVN